MRAVPIPLQWGRAWDDGRASGLLPEEELGHSRRGLPPGSEALALGEKGWGSPGL